MGSEDQVTSMAMVFLPAIPGVQSNDPSSATLVTHWLRVAKKVEVPIAIVNSTLCCRISACIYNESSEYDALGDAIEQLTDLDAAAVQATLHACQWPSHEFESPANKR